MVNPNYAQVKNPYTGEIVPIEIAGKEPTEQEFRAAMEAFAKASKPKSGAAVGAMAGAMVGQKPGLNETGKLLLDVVKAAPAKKTTAKTTSKTTPKTTAKPKQTLKTLVIDKWNKGEIVGTRTPVMALADEIINAMNLSSEDQSKLRTYASTAIDGNDFARKAYGMLGLDPALRQALAKAFPPSAQKQYQESGAVQDVTLDALALFLPDPISKSLRILAPQIRAMAAGAGRKSGEVVGNAVAKASKTSKVPDEVIHLAGGLNPVDVIKRADDLNIPGFSVTRRTKDYHIGHRLLSPLSMVDDAGKTLQKGTYERLGGAAGKVASTAIRDAERQITQGALAYERMVDIVEHQMGESMKLLGAKNKDQYSKEFIELIEKEFKDPTRVGRNPAEQEALLLHDRMTEEFKNYIVKSRKDLGIDMPADWGITEKGYFRHLFLGDVVLKDGPQLIGTARTYAEAQKMAIEYLKTNPTAKLHAEARNVFAGDPTTRVSTAKYFKMVGDMADKVGLSKEDIMEDITGVIGRKAAKQKFFGSLMKREGAEGFDKAYADVMRFHAQQMVRTQELSKLNRAIQPVIENIRKGKGTPGNRELPGLADHIQNHVDALWGTPSQFEKDVGNLLAQIPVLRNHIASPAMALRGFANQLTKLQTWLKLHTSIKAPLVNALQPFSSLWPYISTKDFAKVYAEALKPTTRQMLAEKGVFRSGTKIEGGGAVAYKHKVGTPFGAASDLNRAVGYLYGRKDALRRGATEEAAHANGLTWAEKVEFDNSVWNAPPVLRTPVGRVAGQFKGFTVKNLEQISSRLTKREGENVMQTAAGILKLAGTLGVQGGISVTGVGAKLFGGYKIAQALQKSLENAGMNQEDAKAWSTAAYYGAPSLVGANISGSVAILDQPYGQTLEEQIINFAAGPTGNVFIQGAKSLGGQGGEKFLKAVTPGTRQIQAIADMIRSGPDGVKVRVAKDQWVHLTPQEATLMILGFYPVRLSERFDKKEARPKQEPGGISGFPKMQFPGFNQGG